MKVKHSIHLYLHIAVGKICRLILAQKPFKFPPPEGFQTINAANTRPVKVISRPDQFVGLTTYTGTTGAGTI